MTELRLVAGTLPVGYCFGSLQELLNKFSEITVAQLPFGLSAFTVSQTAPPADERESTVWFKVDAGRTIERIYVWSNTYGKWLSEHPIPANDHEWRIFAADAALIPLKDGGTAGTATVTTGPFWEKVTEMEARIPLGAGTLPVSGNTVSVGDTGGSDQHTITKAELPKHTHPPTSPDQPISLHTGTGALGNLGGGSNLMYAQQELQSVGEDKPINILPPYYGVHYIRRTKRKYYAA